MATQERDTVTTTDGTTRTVYTRESNGTGWFVGIIVVLALLAIGYLVFSANNNTSAPAATGGTPAVSAPATGDAPAAMTEAPAATEPATTNAAPAATDAAPAATAPAATDAPPAAPAAP